MEGEVKSEKVEVKNVESEVKSVESEEKAVESGKNEVKSEEREVKSVKGGLMGGISIAHLPQVKVQAPRLQGDVKPLTQEDLERYWRETAEELGLVLLMEKGVPRLGEHSGRIEIDAQTVYFHEEFKEHRIDVMESLRRRTGMPMLECKVNPRFVEKEDVLYSPIDKYNAMLKVNPSLVELRKIFPQIDY